MKLVGADFVWKLPELLIVIKDMTVDSLQADNGLAETGIFHPAAQIEPGIFDTRRIGVAQTVKPAPLPLTTPMKSGAVFFAI